MKVVTRRDMLLQLITIVLIAGCQSTRTPLISTDSANSTLPKQWHHKHARAVPQQPHEALPQKWLASLNAPFLNDAVVQALANNYQLKQQALQLQAAQQNVVLARADRLPGLNLSLAGQRQRSATSNTSEQVDISASASFELDLWGKLSDAQRAAKYTFAAEELRFLRTQHQLVAQVVNNTFNLISTQQLVQLFEARLRNLVQGLDVIEKGYRSGLNEALDVYLAQTTVEQERANVANQQQLRFEAATSLQRLTAHYPNAELAVAEDLPRLTALPNAGIPAELLTRRPDIQSAWLDLLAADAQLAVAHKNRFPSLDLSASVRDVDSAVSRLLDGGNLAFSIAASLVTPLFTGGRLAALNEQARLRVMQTEQNYLHTVYGALAEVENELSRAVSLSDRFNAFQQAQANAEAATTLAFDQYQKGLVNFTTVLEAQRRAFDAQTTVVQLRNQRLQNRVALLLALGGDY